MQILDGKLVSQVRREALKSKIIEFRQKFARAPKLAVVLVGDLVASQVYVRNKERSCQEVGIESVKILLPAESTQIELNETIQKLNNDESVDGILVQLPLPKGLNSNQLNQLIRADKDADGFTFENLGTFFAGQEVVAPCTPKGVMSILEHYKINVAGMKAVVVGRSLIVGKPMAQMLIEANATVTVCHSKTRDLRSETQTADLVVVAAGQPHLLGRDDFKEGAIVIDVGMHGTGNSQKLVGDVRFEELRGWVKAATPVPGGVGPMTITTLLENTVLLAEHRMLKK